VSRIGTALRADDLTSSTLRFVVKDEIKALAHGRNFATISTLLPSGQIQTHVVWVDCDDDHIVINTEVELRKYKNVQADPRVTITIWDKKNPYVFAEVRGRVVQTVTGPQARANIDAMAQKYLGSDYPDELIRSERVILKIAPDSQIVFARGMHDIRR
jgi:PPOX class probable F420-dependent enzyme